MEIDHLTKEAFSAFMEAGRQDSAGNLVAADQAFAKSIAMNKEAIVLAKLYNQKSEKPMDVTPIAQRAVSGLFMQADAAESGGDVGRGERLREEALQLSGSYLGTFGNAESERARASSLTMQGHFSEALVALASSRDQFQALEEVTKVIRATMDMVDILQWLNDYERAAKELSRAASVSKPLLEKQKKNATYPSALREEFKQIEEMAELSRVQLELDYYQGLIQKGLGNFGEAERNFRKVLASYQSQGAGEAIEFQLAFLLSKQGEHAAAWSLLQRLLPKFHSDGRFRPKLAALMKIQAETLHKSGRTEDALLTLNQAIADLGSYKDPDQLWRCWALRSELLESLRRNDEALAAYQKTAAVINSLRLHPLGHRLDSTFLKDKLPVFDAAIDLCCASARARECAEFMEMVKSRALLAVLSAPASVGASTGVQEQQFEKITQELDVLEYREFREGISPDTESQKQALLAERSQLLERLHYSDQRWRSLSEPVATNIEEISRVLAARDQALITLYYRPGKVVAVLLQGSTYTAETIEVSPQTLKAVNANIVNLHSSNPDYPQYDLSAAMGLGAKHLIPPRLIEMALESSQLVIVPHGPLHLVPWAGLIFGGQRLFQYCPVGILPNLGCITALRTELLHQPRLAAIGAPDYGAMRFLPALPSTAKEIQDLDGLYATSMIEAPLTGKAATAANFWRLLGCRDAKGILHVACHASFEPIEPMRSGLLLADAKVDAAEIARVRITFEEVVLSACSTGCRPSEVGGIALAGDDILGLPAAFLEAGAVAVLVSIPSADDQASAAFVMEYHQNRRVGKSPLAALQQAQLAMMESQFEPFQWIGFTAYAGQ